MEKAKKPYVAPKLTVHGDVEAITQATTTGSYLDGNYSYGTPLANGILS